MNSGERLRLLFGFMTLAVITAIAIMIAVGSVTQETSYGLEPILVALTSVAASFCNWAFSREARSVSSPESKPEEEKPKPEHPTKS